MNYIECYIRKRKKKKAKTNNFQHVSNIFA